MNHLKLATKISHRLMTIGLVSVGLLLSVASFKPTSAQTVETESNEPGSFACSQNLNDVCQNEDRLTTDNWTCANNPGPQCTTPPRIEQPLESRNWVCINNQNVVACENPIRYTVDEPDLWPSHFPNNSQ